MSIEEQLSKPWKVHNGDIVIAETSSIVVTRKDDPLRKTDVFRSPVFRIALVNNTTLAKYICDLHNEARSK